MKKLFATVVFLLVIGALVAANQRQLLRWPRPAMPAFRTTEVSRGKMTTVVRATGTVNPVSAVEVGAFISGPIVEIHADFNDTVTKDQLIARIDPRIYKSEVSREQASLTTAKAEVRRVDALLQQAKNEEARGLAVKDDNEGYISDSDLDALKFNRMSLEAQAELAQANVLQAKARLENAQANLGYTEIRSPVDGVVIDRRVEPGQTVAAAFATPVLFVVAPDLAGEMRIIANVDEADIGMVRDAQEAGRPAIFTVDAYPQEKFEGKVIQVRSSSKIIEGVVTFPVVVSTTNASRKLLPGMTANLLFVTKVKEDVLRVPNAAIRFYPPVELVRPQDRELIQPDLLGWQAEASADTDYDLQSLETEERNRRHVWVVDGTLLRAVQVVIGIANDHFTEIETDELVEGDQIVTGLDT